MIPLRKLNARFIGEYTPKSYRIVDTIDQAQGVIFQCPKCALGAEYNGTAFIGVHSVICWFNNRGIPDSASPSPGRWNPSGTSLDDLTFVPPGAVSILLTGEGGCGWHGYVVSGEAG